MEKEISAEFLLNYLYPGMRKQWRILQKGTFYRNYNGDAMKVAFAEGYVELSRDGILGLLPESLLTPNSDTHASYDEVHKRLNLLREAFSPIDSIYFNYHLKVEHNISLILDSRLKYILKEYFSYDMEAETDPLRRQVAPLLPYVVQLRGDIPFVRSLLSVLTGHKVTTRQSAWSDIDNSRRWFPKTTFCIIENGLTPMQYMQERERISPVTEMLCQWFMPFDMITKIEIHGESSNYSILDYNIETNQ